ncbi:alpha/beta hydrolase [Klugiella xanthotipulae]|uniref:Alpha/beta hydrolase family protein n=1 Tax=Klugiella xanthotipulae TaxID=244735 RepID=A0A543I453_9MICO|nr:alpha/beta hydrolase [Klugiella xanthotipulae]TQM65374.1 alpha/beta hydrolase family protein [Klugiella xanthotipulae]
MTTSTQSRTRASLGKAVLHAVAWAIVVVLVLAVAFLVWANSPMHGNRAAAIEVWKNPAVSVESTSTSIILTPTGGVANGTGLVFIPGARVDPYAYMNILSGVVAEEGVTVVITKPTLNLAFFDQRPLAAFTDPVSGVDTWYVGGHSLGGVRACMMAESEDVAGLVLFGSYCATDLADSGLDVLSLAGSNDGLSTPVKVADARSLLPASAQMVTIEGANHARFGDYGVQAGDGTATISRAAMRATVTDQLSSFLD